MIVSPDRRIVDENGNQSQRMLVWTDQVTKLQVLTGSGSPEGVIPAPITKFYMNTVGAAGSILYIKRDADIGGDKKQGWILV